jgi:hypothetical protein
MNLRTTLQLLALATLAPATALYAGDVKIIANPSVAEQSVSADDVKGIFLQTKESLGSTHVVPVLHKGGSLEDSFCQKYVGKNDSALQTYYRSLVFTGRALMPKVFETDEEVIEYVAKTKGAVGFVTSTAKLSGVVVLTVK